MQHTVTLLMDYNVFLILEVNVILWQEHFVQHQMELISNKDLTAFPLTIIHAIKILEVFVITLICWIGVKLIIILIIALHKMVKIALMWINSIVWLLMANSVIHKWHSLILEDIVGQMMQFVAQITIYLIVILQEARYVKHLKMQHFVLLKIIIHVYKIMDIIAIILLIWQVAI